MATTLLGGLILGGVGFLAGFIGPMVFAPDANQGPLAGILFTGPLGFDLGVVIALVLRAVPHPTTRRALRLCRWRRELRTDQAERRGRAP